VLCFQEVIVKSLADMKDPLDGREAQFEEMIEMLELFQKKYRGVRGELLKKVRAELMRLKPTRSAPPSAPVLAAVPSAAPVETPPVAGKAAVLPSCRMCGRAMKLGGDSLLVCQNGHMRAVT
jgi:hypothetical protein